jgi:hypothetical protein
MYLGQRAGIVKDIIRDHEFLAEERDDFMMRFINAARQWLGSTVNINNYSWIRRRKPRISPASSTAPGALMKDRPLSLEERYRITDDARAVESVFKRLAVPLMDVCDQISFVEREKPQGRVVLRELGNTADRRSYLFMKALNDYGWLVERGGAGWRVSRAEKIIGQDMFLRSSDDPWDVATVWSDPKGEGMPRVRSTRFGGELMSVTEYERRLVEAMRSQLAQAVN